MLCSELLHACEHLGREQEAGLSHCAQELDGSVGRSAWLNHPNAPGQIQERSYQPLPGHETRDGMSEISGLHHVTATAGDPQNNIDFYAGVLGLLFVKPRTSAEIAPVH